MNPPTNGDANGPTKTAMAKIEMAMPRVVLLYMSAKHAGTIARGEAEKKPEKNRVSISVWVSFAVAEATAKMAKPKRPRRRGILLPYNSDIGAQRIGPEANPIT